MTLDQISPQPGIISTDVLDRLESAWLSGEFPNIAQFLQQSRASSAEVRCSLVELDLEYRWKRYHNGSSTAGRDSFGFPRFPRLEDYANLLDAKERSDLLNPRLLAEEYRVRQFWGDQPSRQQFLDRLPQQSQAIEYALNRIDTEFEAEGMTPLEEEPVESPDPESTVLNHNKLPFSESSAPTLNIGKYQLKTLLGRGGFGEVWKAYDPSLKRHIALKFPRPDREFSPELMEFFRREAQKMAALEQVPGVVPVYESGEANGVPYIVSLLIDGNNLGVLHKQGPLPFEESVRIVADVATTLHRAHLNNLIHRDVKLSNILVNREGRAYLSDFGLCVSEDEQLHESQSATGTFAYMSPEQIQSQSHRVDGRADIYSLGVVLYRLLTNRFPFVAETSAEYMDQALHREPRPLRSINDLIPAELERICLKCLRKPIPERYTTAGDLADDLRAFLARTVTSDPRPLVSPAPVETFARTNASRMRRLAGVFALLCLLAGMIAVSYLPRSGDPPIVTPAKDEFKTIAAGTDTHADQTSSKANIEDVLFVRDVSPVLSRRGIWEVREEENAVLVSTSFKQVLKSLDQFNGRESLRFEIDFKEMNVGSTLGIFFGMSESQANSQNAQWQVLLIDYEDRGSYRVSLESRELDGVREGSEGLGFQYFTSMDQKISVVMTISKHGLESLQIQDNDYRDLVSEYRQRKSQSLSGIGRFGLVCQSGKGVFSDPVINGNRKIFRRVRN